LIYSFLADIVTIIHLLFILFVIFGGFLVLKWRWIIYFHIPAAVWGALIEFKGWICPLTPWENQLRQAGGEAGYSGGFIEHYLIPVIYPDELTRQLQFILGVFVIVINIAIYSWIIYRWRKKANAGSERIKP